MTQKLCISAFVPNNCKWNFVLLVHCCFFIDCFSLLLCTGSFLSDLYLSFFMFYGFFSPINHIQYLPSIFSSFKHLNACNRNYLAIGALTFIQKNNFQAWCTLSEVSSESSNGSCKS